MSTINEKLFRLEGYKSDIKQAIIAKGQSVGDNMAEFANAISKISGGGGGDEPIFSDTDPLTFVRVDELSNDGYVGLNNNGTINAKAFQYNKNGTGWQDYTIGDKIYLQKYEYVQFRSTDNLAVSTGTSRYRFFKTNGIYKTYGQLSSLYAGTTFTSTYMFYSLFRYTNIITAPKLPNIVTANCYQYTFQYCTSLVTAPELPATTLKSNCYQNMFSGCTSLVNAPELPATTLQAACYYGMFQNCISLVNTPELIATTLATQCYSNMFQGCTSLVNAPELPVTKLAPQCYQYMFSDCTSIVNAPELPATTLDTYCYYYMFQNCTSLVNAPELPVTALKMDCYAYMFSGCISLVNAPELPATTLAQYCYTYMFQNCTSLKYIKVGATNWITSYTSNWVTGVPSGGTFVKPSETSIATGVNGIPSGWTVENV